jgi:hypothetical protein
MGSVIYLPLNAGRFLLELLRRALSGLTPPQMLALRAQAAAQAPLVAQGVAALLAAALPAAHDTAAAAAGGTAAAGAATRNTTAAAAAAVAWNATAAAPAAAVAGPGAAAATAGVLHPAASEAALLAAVWGDPLPVAWAIGWDRLLQEIYAHVRPGRGWGESLGVGLGARRRARSEGRGQAAIFEARRGGCAFSSLCLIEWPLSGGVCS